MDTIVSDAVPMAPEQVHQHDENIDILTRPTLGNLPTNSVPDEDNFDKKISHEDTAEDFFEGFVRNGTSQLKQESFDEKLGSNAEEEKEKIKEHTMDYQELRDSSSETASMADTVSTTVETIEDTSDNETNNPVTIHNGISNPFNEAFNTNNSDQSEPRKENCNEGGNVHNNIVINNPKGIIHLGPTVNLRVQNSFTQVNNDNTGEINNDSAEGGVKNKSVIPSKDSMRPLWYSNRLVEEEDLMRLSKNIGKDWKDVGNGLKFNWAQLEQFEKDTRSVSEAVYRMLFRWIQWKDSKATVGRLTKVLFNHNQFDAIRCLSP